MKQTLFDKIILRLISEISTSDHTLINGKSGILIALSYYYSYHLNKKIERTVNEGIQHCINDLLEDIESKPMDGSLAFGLSGISYSLNVAKELGQDKKINSEWFEALNEIIIASFENDLKMREYDLLRGASGIVNYLLKHNYNKDYFNEYINSLNKNAVWITNESCYWIFYSYNEEKKILEYREDIINLGLAHGISSIISLLSELYSKGLNKVICYKLINGAINYLKTVESINSISLFSGIIYQGINKQNTSRLGWCYGDLSVGISILKAGILCKDASWVQYGNKICLNSTKRTFQDAGLEEHGICHGFLGAMHFYNRLYKETGDSAFLTKKEYWYNIGMSERIFNIDSLGFFQTELNSGNVDKFTTNGLLQGLSGVFLCLASYKKIEYPWDSIFLTNLDV